MIIIKEEEKEYILKQFPKIELSYEKFTHNKVYDYDVMVAIPEGINSFIWFHVYKDQNVCYLLELNEKKQIFQITDLVYVSRVNPLKEILDGEDMIEPIEVMKHDTYISPINYKG